MTLLAKADGASTADGTSYLELAEWIARYGSALQDDLRELWRRVVFSIAVANTDDHLRNHGFLLDKDGWRLSPAYDLNPNPTGTGLALNISMEDNRLDFNLAREVAPYFRIKSSEAEEIIKKACLVVRYWQNYARQVGISDAEQEEMAPAFDLVVRS
jgi:serine/threonine-protein kinase HipA